jgi:hypothetical protein
VHYLLEFGDHPIQKPQPSAAGRGRRLLPHLVEQAQNEYTTIAGARFSNGILVERTGEEAADEGPPENANPGMTIAR